MVVDGANEPGTLLVGRDERLYKSRPTCKKKTDVEGKEIGV